MRGRSRSTLVSTGTRPGGPGRAGRDPAGPGDVPGAGPGPQVVACASARQHTGWALMTPDERNAHRDKMRAAKTVDECRSIQSEQRKTVEGARQGRALPPRQAPLRHAIACRSAASSASRRRSEPGEVCMSQPIEVRLTQESGFRFSIDFGGGLVRSPATKRRPPGQGSGRHPCTCWPRRWANCLSDSLHFAITKFKQDARGIATTVKAEVGRNAEGRMRVLGMDVEVRLGAPAAGLNILDRALAQFETLLHRRASVGRGDRSGRRVRRRGSPGQVREVRDGGAAEVA